METMQSSGHAQGGMSLTTKIVIGMVAGLIVGGVMASKGSAITAELDDLYMSNGSETAIADARARGKSANLGAGLGFGLVGGLGVVAIAVGAVLFVRAKKQSDEQAHLRVLPTFGGLALQGRF